MTINYEELYRRGHESGGESFEAIIQALYTRLMRPGDRVVDGGANVGRHTFPMASAVGESGHVCAIEPIPSLAERLRTSAPANVSVLNVALGRQDLDEQTFFMSKAATGLSSLRDPRHHPAMAENMLDQVEAIRVRQRSIDSLIAEGQLSVPISFLKLDLEGGELHALQGATSLLKNCRPVAVFECGFEYSSNLFGYSQGEYFGFFTAQNYRLFDLFCREFPPKTATGGGIPWYLIGVAAGSRHEAAIASGSLFTEIVQTLA